MDSLLLNGQSDSLAGVSVHQSLVPPDEQSQLPHNNLPVRVEPCSDSRAINQRGCVATGSLDDSCDDQQLSLPQSGLPAEDNDGGQWQVVSYRNDRRKRDKHNKHQGIKKVVHADTCCVVSTGAAASSSAISAQASSELTAGRCSLAGNRPFRLAANVTDSQWQGCLRSFGYLGKISGLVFYDIMRRHQKYVQQSGQPGAFVHVSKREFARFQRMMVAGPESITQVQDIFFLAAPFKVFLSHHGASPFTILLSLIFEEVVPGFLFHLHESFAHGLSFINLGNGNTFFAIAEQLTVLCRQDERYLERFCWQELPARSKCNLFSCVAYIFKKNRRTDMVRELNERCDRPWLVEHFQAVVAEVPEVGGSGWLKWVHDLQSVLRANFFWLEHQFFEVDQQDNDCIWVVEFAGMVEAVMAVLGDVPVGVSSLGEMMVNVFRVIAQWTVHFSNFLNRHLGHDRTIDLLKSLLQHISPVNSLSNRAFELRMTLLGVMLTKCEDLSQRRDRSELTQTWDHCSATIERQLDICREFMQGSEPPPHSSGKPDLFRRYTFAHLNLQLRESAYRRMCCQLKKTSPQEIRKHGQTYRLIYDEQWKLSPHHKEIGTIELAKWYFLAGDLCEAVDILLKTPFSHNNLSEQKAKLLTTFGAYKASNDELRRNMALFSGNSRAHQCKRNQLDSQIAMNLLWRYKTENNSDHLIEAFHLAVDVFGRCEPADRDRFEGALGHIVNAMKFSGLKFQHFVAQTSVLSFLVKQGSSIKSWQHFSDLLHFRHKAGLTDASTLDTVVRAVEGSGTIFVKVVQTARS